MSSWIPSVQWGTKAGQPLITARGKVTPISSSLLVRFPFGGFVWNKPVAIDLEQGGHIQHLPVVDITRLAIMTMTGVGIVMSALAILLAFSNKLQNNS
jgi:hypothetical protein